MFSRIMTSVRDYFTWTYPVAGSEASNAVSAADINGYIGTDLDSFLTEVIAES